MSDSAHTFMPEWLRQRAHLTPDRLALLTADDSLTFAQLDAAVEETADALAHAGLAPGDMVGLLANNSAGFVKVVHALARLGAVLMPLNVRLTAEEITWQLADCGATWLLHDETNAGGALSVHEGGQKLQRVALVDLQAPRQPLHHPPLRKWGGGPEGRGLFHTPLDLSATQAVVYTSGTTGRPKGAILTFGNHFWSATGSALNLGLLPDDRWLACLPLFHVGGLSILFRSALYGIPAVVHESFDAERVNQAIEDDGVSIVSVVSVMLERMLDARSDRPYPPQLRCVLLGGGPASQSLLERCAAAGVPVVQTYGLTESASQVATLSPEDALRKRGSAGKPLFPNEIRVVRDDGADCASGEAGEIVVRGPSITPGYLKRPEETARALRGGWFHTGDIGYLDAEGYLYVLDRRDDLIVSGGENVYPAEVESVLQSHPSVLDAGVVGVADAHWGQRPLAIVVLRPEHSTTSDALLAFCRARLAAYKLPARLIIEARPLPRNAAGKLQRNLLRQRIDGASEEALESSSG